MNRIDNDELGSLHSKVFKEIENAILSGDLAPGYNLTEQKLCVELGVSRTPVREALRQLELEGLVMSVPNKGVVVVGVSEKDIDDIYTIRMLVEGLAAKWAATNITEEELTQLRDTVELQEFYLEKNDTLQIRHLDSLFHQRIYTASRSRPLRQILSQFHNYIQKPREISVKYSGRAAASVDEHRKIYEAIAAHEPDNAEALAKEHISKAKNNLLKIIKE